MSTETDSTKSSTPAPCPLSQGNTLIWLVVVGLAVSNFMLHQRLAGIERQINARLPGQGGVAPLSPAEVARQFEERTTVNPITVSVKDVRYSPNDDSYKVDFSWTNAKTNETWLSDIKLKADGYGSYFGQIHNGPFLEPLGQKDAYTVLVKTPSPLAD